MCAEKCDDKSDKTIKSSCCDGMTGMMKNCCPDGVGVSDCLAKMKEKFCGQKTDDEASEYEKGCWG